MAAEFYQVKYQTLCTSQDARECSTYHLTLEFLQLGRGVADELNGVQSVLYSIQTVLAVSFLKHESTIKESDHRKILCVKSRPLTVTLRLIEGVLCRHCDRCGGFVAFLFSWKDRSLWTHFQNTIYHKLGRYRFILFTIYRQQYIAIFDIIAIN